MERELGLLDDEQQVELRGETDVLDVDQPRGGLARPLRQYCGARHAHVMTRRGHTLFSSTRQVHRHVTHHVNVDVLHDRNSRFFLDLKLLFI